MGYWNLLFLVFAPEFFDFDFTMRIIFEGGTAVTPEHDTQVRDGFAVLVLLSRIYVRLSECICIRTLMYLCECYSTDKQSE
jgi:hypothetical protein